MKNKQTSPFYPLNPSLNTDEKIELINGVLEKLIYHFHVKADKGKRSFEILGELKLRSDSALSPSRAGISVGIESPEWGFDQDLS